MTTDEQRKQWYAANPERVRAYSKRGNERQKAARKVDLEERLRLQGGRCMICGTASAKLWHRDHDHDTEEPRGVLCSKCNNGLGYFNDSIERLEDAVIYLRIWSTDYTKEPG